MGQDKEKYLIMKIIKHQKR